jgi:L-alanine-DL-glutamate epimerase-like enolase superfamily enzyme
LPEVGVHLACGVVWGRVAEYVDWLTGLFDGGPRFENGQLVVSEDSGLGLTLIEAAAAKWRA